MSNPAFDLDDIDPDDSLRSAASVHPGDADPTEPPAREIFEPADSSELPEQRKLGSPEFTHGPAGAGPYVQNRHTNYVAPKNRPKRTRRPNQFMAGQLREQIVLKWPLAPQAVLDARDEAARAIDAYADAVTAVRSLEANQEAETRRNQELVAQSVRDGERTPKIERTDWASERVVREVRHEELFRSAEQAVRKFKVVSKASEKEWEAGLLEGLETLREQARKAVSEAAESFREWRAAIEAAHRMAIDTARFWPDYHMQPDRDTNPRAALGSLDKLLAVVESEDPVISGAYLTTEDDMTPPSWTRQALNRKAERGDSYSEALLARIEASEQFKVTAYTPLHLRANYLAAAKDDREITWLLAEKRLSRPAD